MGSTPYWGDGIVSSETNKKFQLRKLVETDEFRCLVRLRRNENQTRVGTNGTDAQTVIPSQSQKWYN